MTFSELKTRVLEDAFPEGPPENLTEWLARAIQSALIEIQRDIPCYQYGHVDVLPACQIYWQAGSAVTTPPKGKIFRVYTIDQAADPNWASPTILRPVPISYLRRWQARWRSHWAWANTLEAPNSGSTPGMGFDLTTETSDSPAGRAGVGLYAIDRVMNQLWVAPWLQYSESLVIEWAGIKREWADADVVPDAHDFLRLVRLWLDLEFGRKFAAADLQIRELTFRDARADMIATCNHERQLHGDPASVEEHAATHWSAYVPETVTTTSDDPGATTICFVGDTVGDEAESVASAVVADEPDYVVLVGNCKDAPNAAEDDMAPYSSFTDSGTLKAVLGNTDLDDGELGSDVRALAQNPGNGRYYSVTYGPVTIFVVNSGINSSDESVEPDGNFEGSVQFSYILSAILRNTSPWKILCVHHPLFSSSETTFPGYADLRWINRLPVHAIISAHARVYERLTVANRDSITVGTGGADLHTFRDSPYPGSQSRVVSFGFLRMTADCDSATIKFVDLDGDVQDTLTLSGDPYVTPPTIIMDPVITTQPTGASVVVGLPYELEVEASGTNPLSYQWKEDGVDMDGENDATLSLATVSESHTYRCLVSNSVGHQLSNNAIVNAVVGSISVVANLAVFHANSYASAAAISLGVDGNGDSGYFVPGGTGTDDGANEIIDSAGRHFIRWRFT